MSRKLPGIPSRVKTGFGYLVSMADLDKMHHDEEQHPRRLASIFAGGNAIDKINIAELRQLLLQ